MKSIFFSCLLVIPLQVFSLRSEATQVDNLEINIEIISVEKIMPVNFIDKLVWTFGFVMGGANKAYQPIPMHAYPINLLNDEVIGRAILEVIDSDGRVLMAVINPIDNLKKLHKAYIIKLSKKFLHDDSKLPINKTSKRFLKELSIKSWNHFKKINGFSDSSSLLAFSVPLTIEEPKRRDFVISAAQVFSILKTNISLSTSKEVL